MTASLSSVRAFVRSFTGAAQGSVARPSAPACSLSNRNTLYVYGLGTSAPPLQFCRPHVLTSTAGLAAMTAEAIRFSLNDLPHLPHTAEAMESRAEHQME